MAVRTEQDPSDESASYRRAFEMLDQLPVPVVIIDRNGKIQVCNRPFADATGRDDEAVEQRFLWEFLSGDRLAQARRYVADGTSDDGSGSWNLLLHDADGGCQLHAWSFRPLAGEDPGEHVLAAAIAVSNGRPAATSTAEDRLIRALVTHSSDVLCVLAPDGALLFASPSIERVLGYRPDELIGTNTLKLVHSDDLEAARQSIEHGLQSPGEPETVELRIRSRAGDWIVMDVRGVVHTEGDTSNMLLNLSDITDRARAKAALSESEERFRSAFENTAIGKVLWDAEGHILRVNRSVRNMLAYPESDLLQLSWSELCHPDDRLGFLPDLRRMLSGETPSAQAVLRVRHRDGAWVWVRATLSAIRGCPGESCQVIGELEDITEQRTSEAEKRARLERQQAHQTAIVEIAIDSTIAHGPLASALKTVTEIAARAAATARASVWFLEDDDQTLRCADLFDASAGDHSSGTTLSSLSYPSYFDALESDRAIDADDARSDPRTREFRDDYLTPLGITSMLDAPIRIRGRVVGVVCLEHIGEPRIWHSDEVAFAAEVADQVAHAVSNAQRTITESRLQLSEERFRSIVNSIPMGVLMYRLTDDNRLIFSGANPAADRILGVNCQHYLGKTLEEAFPPLANTEIPDRYRAAAASGSPWHTEQVVYRDDRIEGAYEVHAFQTAPGTIAVVFHDITDRKLADDTLRRSEARYRSLFERNLAGVYRSSVDGTITECNEALAAILGCSSPAEVMGRPAHEFYPGPDDRNQLIAALEAEGELRNLELQLRRADGSTVWVLANMSLDRNDDGAPVALEGTMIDISELKQATDRLRLQSTALSSAANAIAVTDPGGVVTWVNPAFTELTGYDDSQAIGKSLWLLKSGASDVPLREDIAAAVAEGRVWHGELVNRRQDGRLYNEELTLTPVRSADGSIDRLIAVQQDVSERKQIEEQLQQAQKMEAVGRLAGGVAHDFNNLLQAMLGVMEILRRRHRDDEQTGSRLLELEEHVRRGSQLTRQLLLFSRRDTARQEHLDLNDVVHGTVRLLHRLLRENIELVFAPADIDMPLVADRGQIEQVVMNLALNACDAMPRGGRLFLQTGLEADRAWLEVADSGEGIPDEIRDQLFEPFFTTKEPGKGTGLGLSVVHSIVTRLGGTIDLDSRVGEGTSIRISLPIVAGEVPSVPQTQRERVIEPTPAATGQRILIVEDDPAVRSGLRELLRLLGYDVSSVGSREETIYLPPAPAFDLLLTDYVLPDGSGTEIAHELRIRWPSLRVIVMSGYAQDVPIGPDLRLDGMEFLQKPFATETLADTVRSVLSEATADSEPDA
jgi:PAS domain S-box-containing protein